MIAFVSIAVLFSGVSAAPSTTNKVIAQMFEWDWDSVAAEVRVSSDVQITLFIPFSARLFWVPLVTGLSKVRSQIVI